MHFKTIKNLKRKHEEVRILFQDRRCSRYLDFVPQLPREKHWSLCLTFHDIPFAIAHLFWAFFCFLKSFINFWKSVFVLLLCFEGKFLYMFVLLSMYIAFLPAVSHFRLTGFFFQSSLLVRIFHFCTARRFCFLRQRPFLTMLTIVHPYTCSLVYYQIPSLCFHICHTLLVEPDLLFLLYNHDNLFLLIEQ